MHVSSKINKQRIKAFNLESFKREIDSKIQFNVHLEKKSQFKKVKFQTDFFFPSSHNSANKTYNEKFNRHITNNFIWNLKQKLSREKSIKR